MPLIYLIHWNVTEANDRAAKLRKLGYDVSYETPTPAILRNLKSNPPDLILIDLSRLPSQGRDVALNLRLGKTTRFVPLVFVEGDPEKLVRIKEHLPDAIYGTWGNISNSIKQALRHPPKNPVVPRSALQGYSDAPLIKKLGIRANSVVVLINAPSGLKSLLGELPDGVKLANRGQGDLVIWFVRLQKVFCSRLQEVSKKLGDDTGLWVAWPKQASGVKSDLTQNIVRRTGLVAGLVDYKVCSIDETWSGLKFRRRKIIH